MKFRLWMAWKMIMGNKRTAIIPCLGMTMGVALVYTLLAIGNGAKESIKSDLSILGENRIMVGGSNREKPLSIEDVKRIERLPGVEYVHLIEPRLLVDIEKGNNVVAQNIQLETYSKKTLDGMGLAKGLSNSGIYLDSSQKDYVKVGERVEVKIGNKVKQLVVQGFVGNELGSSKAIVLRDSIEELLKNPRGRELIIGFGEKSNPKESYNLILKIVNKSFRDNYQIIESNARYERVQKILKILNWSVGTMGAVALMLGAASTANMTLLSIKERSGSIGIMKAMGIEKIENIFTLETIGIGVVGGLIGLPVGMISIGIIEQIVKLRANYNLSQGMLAIGLALIISILAGWYPAKKIGELEVKEVIDR